MSDELTQIRAAIPAYAGHADAAARRLSDQQLRAAVGERLAAVRERLPGGPAAAALDELVMHCQFGDQHVIKALESDRFAQPALVAELEAEDAHVLAAAAGSESVDATGLPAFIEALDAAFRRRNEALVRTGAGSRS
jgi:hypothetical protein